MDRFGALALAMVTVVTACGGASAQQQDPAGMSLVLETSTAFARAPDFAARLDDTIDVALAYWGGDRKDLDGKTIELVDEQYPRVCASESALGCFDGHTIAVTTRDPSAGPFVCIEQTALVHEIGHAVIGDPDHLDPRWMEMDTVAATLGGRVGYTADGNPPCTVYVSVWRHPLGTP